MTLLQSQRSRYLLNAAVPELEGVEIYAGIGRFSVLEDGIGATDFASFLDQGGDPYDLWRAVIMRWVARRARQQIPGDLGLSVWMDWQEAVNWFKQAPEEAAKVMQRSRSWKGLILFDGLNRLSDDPCRIKDIVRGLLRSVLWLKGFPGLHAKVFLSKEQFGCDVLNFPDASKISFYREELS